MGKMKQKRLGQNLYEYGFVILAVKFLLDASSLFKRPEWIDTLLILSFFGVMIWKIALQSYTMTRLLVYGLMGVVCAYTCIKGNYFFILFSFLGIIAMQDVDLKEVVRKTSNVKIAILLIHILVYFVILLVTPDKIDYVYRNGIRRHYFFLGHPNTFSMLTLWTSMEYLYSRYDKLKVINLVVIWIINLLTYQFTNSNTGVLVTTIAVALSICDKKNVKRIINMLKPLSKYSFAACSIAIPLFVASYTKFSGRMMGIFNSINDLFTGRLLFGAYIYDVYGFTLLGRTISFAPKIYWRGQWFDAIVLDNSYIWLFVMYGSLYLIILSIAFYLIAKSTSNIEKILIISYTFYGIMEAYIINAASCFPILLIGKYLYIKIQEKRALKVKNKISREGNYGH
ncbi:hypothetical protein [Anaerosporobacter sp.]